MSDDKAVFAVKVNLFPADKCADEFGVENTRRWIRGMITYSDTIKPVHFNNPESLLAILDQLKQGIDNVGAKENNKGLTVKVIVFPAGKCGVILDYETKKDKIFNDFQELLDILDRWNLEKWGIEL